MITADNTYDSKVANELPTQKPDQEGSLVRGSGEPFEPIQFDFTDIHINLTEPTDSLIFPGPTKPDTEVANLIKEIVGRVESIRKKDFMVTIRGVFFRGRRDENVVDGKWLRLRRMASEAPTLDSLPSPIPSPIKALLSAPEMMQGGLIYIIGSPGSGKTTTCSAALVSRLEQYGGYAYTVEDPPEMPLNGWHKNGYCAQTWVGGETNADWQEAFRVVLRSQPTGTHCILYVGEVRDSESASAILRAASSGFLVFATGFGNDIPSALDGLIRLAAGSTDLRSVQDIAASVLRLALHQRLVDGKLSLRSLASVNGRTPIANKIRGGMTQHLEGDIQFQTNQLMQNVNIFAEQKKKVA